MNLNNNVLFLSFLLWTEYYFWLPIEVATVEAVRRQRVKLSKAKKKDINSKVSQIKNFCFLLEMYPNFISTKHFRINKISHKILLEQKTL